MWESYKESFMIVYRGFLLLLLAVGLLLAQSPTATVVGIIKDQSGAQVPAASVTLRHIETGEAREITSNAEGELWVSTL